MRSASIAAILGALAMLGACTPPERSNGDGDGDGGSITSDGGPVIPDAGPAGCEKIDFLFVIDNSGSMAEEQANLRQNFPAVAQVIDGLRSSRGTPIDYRIAITTAGRDVRWQLGGPGEPVIFEEQGDDGAFRGGCFLDRRWLQRGDPDMVATFQCRADVSVNGPGAETELGGGLDLRG